MDTLVRFCFPIGSNPIKYGECLLDVSDKGRQKVLEFFLKSMPSEDPSYPIRIFSDNAPMGGDFWITRWRQYEFKMWVYPKDKKVVKVGNKYLFS